MNSDDHNRSPDNEADERHSPSGPLAEETSQPSDIPPKDTGNRSADAKPEGPDSQALPERLPVLPLRDSVAFPGTIMPLSVGRDKSKRLVEAAAAQGNLICVVAQQTKDVDDPTPEDLYSVGTICTILKLLKLPDGTQNILIHGLPRCVIQEIVQTTPYLVARLQAKEDSPDTSPEIDALVHNAKQSAYRVFELSPSVPEEARVVLDNIDTPGGVADFLAANLSVDLAQRQELLEAFDVADRLKKVNRALAEQVEVLELSNKLQARVREQIDQSQRQYFLQEQLKAIQTELGEADSRTAEIDQLRQRILEARMPESARKEADRELLRMGRIPQASPEYSVALDYVHWMCDLPWAVSTEDRLNLDEAERILDRDHYGLEKVKKRILEFLAVRKLNPHGRGPILCLVGPPGVGKTSLGQSIARAMKRKFIRISLGGLHDEAQLRGHRRTYIGAMPGRILQEIRKAGSNNPVFMLDEVDKIGQDFRGDPASALLEVLDPEQNHAYVDNYIDTAFDLSKVMFIATANYPDPIPIPLMDRMEVIPLAGYTLKEKLFIAKRYLVPRQRELHGLKGRTLTFTDKALTKIAAFYTREAGVRNLEREIGTVARAVATRVARGRRKPGSITDIKLSDYLGPERFGHETAQRTSIPGVATGLAFTPTGGEILFIEATTMAGKGQLTLTGQIGDVMKESAMAAFSIVRSRSHELRIDNALLERSDIHVHVPAGAVPKDGPSAGLAILTSMVSRFTGRLCRHDIAMTGEITLTGRVLPIGGVKEKVLAAQRAGIARVILPSENRKDLVDLPAETRRKMKFTFVDSIEQALRKVLEPARQKAGARKNGPARRMD